MHQPRIYTLNRSEVGVICSLCEEQMKKHYLRELKAEVTEAGGLTLGEEDQIPLFSSCSNVKNHAWDPAKHPRHQKGNPQGGKFAPKAGEASGNPAHGFFGTIYNELLSKEPDGNRDDLRNMASERFVQVSRELQEKFGLNVTQARDLLDSTLGRHMADQIGTEGPASAYPRLERAVKNWKRSYEPSMYSMDDGESYGDVELYEEVVSPELSEQMRVFAAPLGKGTWRTVRGRHIFIKEGESVQDALARSGVKVESSALKLAKKMVDEMGGDNGVTFLPTDKQLADLADAVDSVTKAGLKLTQEVIEDITAGEQGEAEQKYGKYDGYKRLSKTLNRIFDGKIKEKSRFGRGSEFSESDRVAELANSNAIRDVEIFASGTHNGDQYTEKDLDDMVSAFNDLDFKPALKVGHTKDKPGSPAYGWITNLKRVGTKLHADLESMHDSVVDAIRNKSYDRLSSEIYFNLKRGGKEFRRALKAVALLGSEVPAVADLVPLHKVEFSELSFEKMGAFEQEFDVPLEKLVETFSERLTGLSNLMKENDMSKNAEQIKQLKAKVEEFSAKMDALMKKKGKAKPEDMEGDEEYKQLSAEAKSISESIARLESEDKSSDSATAKELAETKAALDKSQTQVKELSDRVTSIEQKERNARIGERVAACKIPAFRSGLSALYAYALENASVKVKVYSKDKDGKDLSEEKPLAEIVDGFVTQINDQGEKLFKALAFSGGRIREDGVQEDSAGKEVQKRVGEYRLKNPTVKTYEEAMKAVLAADDDLSKRYRAELGTEQ